MTELNYSTYLQIDGLLSLQDPHLEPVEHDESLFIIFHQTSELWFKMLLLELDRLTPALSDGQAFTAIGGLTRIRRILHSLVDQMDILETLTPLGFNAFRDRLDTASGFQSMQFREIEFLFGLKRPNALDAYAADLPGLSEARRRLAEPSVVDALYRFVAHHGGEVPVDLLERDVTQPVEADETFTQTLLRMYRNDGELRIVFELLTDLDSLLQEWRYRHLKVVERTIGQKLGTGGSAGVEYLKRSLFRQAFPDLWAMRHAM